MKNKPKTVKELCEFIWYLEDKYDLLDFEVDDVKIWQHTRMKLYYKLAEASGVLSQPHGKSHKLSKLKRTLITIKNSLKDNYFTLQKNDIVFFSHPRIVNVDGKFIDIYTQYLIDELLENGKEIIELESPYLGEHKKIKTNYSHYIDWIILLRKFYNYFINIEFSNAQLKLIKNIEYEVNQYYNIDIDLKSFFKNELNLFKTQYRIYKKVFKKINPKKLYIIVPYFNSFIVKAAKEQNIEVIELQHGTFSKYHLGYSFPDREKPLEYFPDKLYVWNEFWEKVIKLPIADECVVNDEFRYLKKQKSKLEYLQKKEKQLVVLSQGAIGNAIAEKFLKYYDRFREYDIKYKLHPGEFDRWQSYPALQKLSKFENIEIVTSNIHLYELFATSSLQVGVFSTALYEGVEFRCDTILLNVNGIEYMDRFIELYQVEVLE